MIFKGAFKNEARDAYAYGVAELWRGFGPAIYAELASYGRDPWEFQSNIAERLGCSVRTVQRWLHFFREEGLLRCWRGGKREVPPGASGPIRCGFSHRALTVWHNAGSYFRKAVEDIKARRAARLKARSAQARGKGMSADEIDRELQKRYGPGPPK